MGKKKKEFCWQNFILKILSIFRGLTSVSFKMSVFRPITGILFNSARALPAISNRFYHEKVIDHYEKPRNVGKLDAKKKNVGTGLVGAPACGDVMKLQIELMIMVKSLMQNSKHLDVVRLLPQVLWQLNGLKENLLMRLEKSRTLILQRNYAFLLLNYIVQCWLRMQSKQL